MVAVYRHLIMMKKIKMIEAQHLLLATIKRITTNSNSLIYLNDRK